MKTSYYLVTAAGLAAAAALVYTRLPGRSGAHAVTPPTATVPLAADPPARLPFGRTDTSLPPIVVPPDGQLVIPAATPPVSIPLLILPEEEHLVLPVPPAVPAIPPLDPLPIPVGNPPLDPLPIPLGAPPVAPLPNPILPRPALPPVPAIPQTPPPLLPPPSPETPPLAQTGAPTGKFVLLKGDKLVEGSVIASGEKAVIRHASFDRAVPKADILFVAETKDEVYHFMLAKVAATDAAKRLGVARWCMFAGLREQALTEAREILKLQPTNTAAADMALSLEGSLKEFPGDGSTQVVAKPTAGTLVAVEPEADVTPEGATAFIARAQPVLANQCMECHARANYLGAFKLIRITGFEVGPQSTNANLRATAAQLKKDDPLNSPLLTKALSAHGGMKQPAFVSRQAGGFRVLEAWTLMAVGSATQPMPTPTQPVLPATPITQPMPTPAASPPVLPPVEPIIPIIPQATTASPVPVPPVVTVPVIPPAQPLPVPVPPIPVPTAEPRIPVVLPTPPSMPPAETIPKVPTPTLPAIPVIPPAASLPKLPGGVQPAGGSGGSQFGTAAPPKPPVTGPAGGDEFDPENFNKAAGTGK
jgi:hypothetical protein